MSDRYEYTNITEKSKQFAINDIGENPSQVNAHVESFRRWVKSMPHLKCPTDADFLLKFLRVAKFDHKKAERRLDNFCTVRTSTRGSPGYFNYFDISDPVVMEFLDSKMQIPLGRNDAGELILLVRAKAWDPEKMSFKNMLTLVFMSIDLMVKDEETQIHGMRMLLDMADVTKKSLEYWGDPKQMKQWTTILQDSYPLRMKGQIFYNEPIIFDIVFQIMSFFQNEKMNSRTFRVKNDIKKAMEKIPGLENILPTEYSGKGGPLIDYAVRWKKRFFEYYKEGSPLSSICVDESKRPPETASYLAEFSEYKGETLGKSGTFTKFENVF